MRESGDRQTEILTDRQRQRRDRDRHTERRERGGWGGRQRERERDRQTETEDVKKKEITRQSFLLKLFDLFLLHKQNLYIHEKIHIFKSTLNRTLIYKQLLEFDKRLFPTIQNSTPSLYLFFLFSHMKCFV